MKIIIYKFKIVNKKKNCKNKKLLEKNYYLIRKKLIKKLFKKKQN